MEERSDISSAARRVLEWTATLAIQQFFHIKKSWAWGETTSEFVPVRLYCVERETKNDNEGDRPGTFVDWPDHHLSFIIPTGAQPSRGSTSVVIVHYYFDRSPNFPCPRPKTPNPTFRVAAKPLFPPHFDTNIKVKSVIVLSFCTQ